MLVRHLLTTGKNIWSRYLHLYPEIPPLVQVDGKVANGQIIGKEGRTGYTCGLTGIHLHYEIAHLYQQLLSVHHQTAAKAQLLQQDQQILFPYFSLSSSTPNDSNYDVYGIAGATLYAALPLRPSTATAFRNVGMRDNVYRDGTIATFFNYATATLSSSSPALTGNAILLANNYQFFAHSDNFDDGYPVKFSVVPANSEIIDNRPFA